jgi:tRNA pseudouridine55 synthase
MQNNLNNLKGTIAVYKPKGISSFGMIRKLRQMTGVKKIGHAGTLDPLASGVLVVGIGREATRELHNSVQAGKEYLANIRLGIESTTDDEEGEKTEVNTEKIPSLEDIERVIPKFEGKIMQAPPAFSAVKIKGERAYKLAREGKDVVMNKRRVEVKKIELLKYKWPFLDLRIETGPGVYIRSLARDIGRELGVGGYLVGLERTRVGEFRIEDCYKITNYE